MKLKLGMEIYKVFEAVLTHTHPPIVRGYGFISIKQMRGDVQFTKATACPCILYKRNVMVEEVVIDESRCI